MIDFLQDAFRKSKAVDAPAVAAKCPIVVGRHKMLVKSLQKAKIAAVHFGRCRHIAAEIDSVLVGDQEPACSKRLASQLIHPSRKIYENIRTFVQQMSDVGKILRPVGHVRQKKVRTRVIANKVFAAALQFVKLRNARIGKRPRRVFLQRLIMLVFGSDRLEKAVWVGLMDQDRYP